MGSLIGSSALPSARVERSGAGIAAGSRPRIAVVGTGYLGATQAVCLAALGFAVTAMDVDQDKVRALDSGVLPFYEPGLPELLQETLRTGRLRFTTDFRQTADADVIFLCVGTPQCADSSAADLHFLEAAVAQIAPQLAQRCLVVGNPRSQSVRRSGCGSSCRAPRRQARLSNWHGIRSSCARGMPSRTPCGRTGWSSA